MNRSRRATLPLRGGKRSRTWLARFAATQGEGCPSLPARPTPTLDPSPQRGRRRSRQARVRTEFQATEARHFRLARPRQALRHDLDPGRRQGPLAVRRQEGRARRNARSAGDRHPADCAGRGDQDGAGGAGRHQDLPLHRHLGRRDHHRRRRGRGRRHLRASAGRSRDPRPLAALHRRDHADPAGLLRHQGRWRAGLRPGAGRRDRGAGAAAGGHRKPHPAAPRRRTSPSSR